MQHIPRFKKYKDSLLGYGVGPIEQHGRMYSKTEVRDAARNLSRSLSDEALENFMSNVKMVGIHQPAREANWEFCPMKPMKGYCAGCTHIFVLANKVSIDTGFGL